VAVFTNISASTAAVANRFVVSVNMKVGAYTLANASPVWQGGCLVTVTHTEVGGGVDTLGTIVVVGTDPSGQTVTDTIVPLNGTVATGVTIFRTITSVTGVGWVIGVGNDTIVVGCAAGSYVTCCSGQLFAIVVNTTAAAAVVVSDARGTIATLKSSIAEGDFQFGANGVNFAGYLKVATTSTNDITVIHSESRPKIYATA
jgi:hypothetical protein